jgi:hypothetical protein
MGLQKGKRWNDALPLGGGIHHSHDEWMLVAQFFFNMKNWKQLCITFYPTLSVNLSKNIPQ